MSPFAQIAATIAPNSTLRRTWQLTGGVSADVTAMELERADGSVQKVVVRQHGAADVQANPHIAADEFTLLTYLQGAGIPVPAPIHYDESGVILLGPYLVIDFVEGSTAIHSATLPDALLQMATTLAAIHRVEQGAALAFLPRHAARLATALQQPPARLDESLSEGAIRAILKAAPPFPPSNPAVLLHGDYWQGNLLWEAEKLVAILDWEDAAVGDPLADVGNSRLELLWAFGEEAMEAFTHHYRAAMPLVDFARLPYWELVAALRPAGKLGGWGLEAVVEAAMRKKHRWFVEQAVARLNTNQGDNG